MMKNCRLFALRKDMKKDLPSSPRRTWWKKALMLTLLAVLLGTLASVAQARTITQIIDATGDGTNPLNDPYSIAVDSSGNVYVTGEDSNNAFKIDLSPKPVPALNPLGMIIMAVMLPGFAFWFFRRRESNS